MWEGSVPTLKHCRRQSMVAGESTEIQSIDRNRSLSMPKNRRGSIGMVYRRASLNCPGRSACQNRPQSYEEIEMECVQLKFEHASVLSEVAHMELARKKMEIELALTKRYITDMNAEVEQLNAKIIVLRSQKSKLQPMIENVKNEMLWNRKYLEVIKKELVKKKESVDNVTEEHEKSTKREEKHVRQIHELKDIIKQEVIKQVGFMCQSNKIIKEKNKIQEEIKEVSFEIYALKHEVEVLKSSSEAITTKFHNFKAIEEAPRSENSITNVHTGKVKNSRKYRQASAA